MSDLNRRVDELAELMVEFGLNEARWSGDGWRVQFSVVSGKARSAAPEEVEPVAPAPRRRPRPQTTTGSAPASSGIPVKSPMNGIYYSSPSPSDPPFVRVGDSIQSGAVIGLIEAMKVYNEVTSPVAGTVREIVAKNGDLVDQGATLILVE